VRSPHLVPQTDRQYSHKISDREYNLLNKGPKYNLHTIRPNWLTDLALEAETAIMQLPDIEFHRKRVTERIETLHKDGPQTHSKHVLQEACTAKSIRSKLEKNNATIARADKGNSLVVIPTEKYEDKIQDFINANKFQKTEANLTKKYQNQIRKTVTQSKHLIPTNSTWRYTNLNPSAPTIKGLIKLHKPGLPVRLVINWRNAPAYKLARSLTQKIREMSPLPYAFNIRNSTQLI
jgi:hypothetical protein